EALKDRDVLSGVGCFSHREKALQIPTLRAAKILSESAAGSGFREACRGRSCHQIPELFVIDSSGQLRRNDTVCERGLRDILPGRLRGRQVRFGERARRETNPRRGELAEAPADVRGELLELESPGRGA